VKHIIVNRVAPVRFQSEGGLETDAARKNAAEVYDSAIRAIMDAHAGVASERRFNTRAVDTVVNQLLLSMAGNERVFLGLAALKGRHEYTFYHSLNVAIVSVLMAMKMKFEPGLLHRLGVAALLHDIGKVRIPNEILDKPGGLSDDEWKIMQSHPLEGARLLSEQDDVDDMSVVVAAQHHLHWDLTGYPPLPGLERVNAVANLVALADVYDALTSDRSYRRAMLPDRALAIILEGRGPHFHPGLTKVFVSVTGFFPVGSCVELSTGEVGVVVGPNPLDCARPQIRLAGPDNAPGELVDLAAPPAVGQPGRDILHALDPEEKHIDIAAFV